MSEHPCPIRGCAVPVAGRMLTCRWHWRMLPQHLRQNIWASWRDGKGRGSLAHYRACEAGIAAVNSKVAGR